ncbi:Isy1-like splicing family protein [Cryptosporidium felis]|nr:Isy1-like splicing family protein [Cryptosporidium felis]
MARNSEKASFMLNRWLSIRDKVSKASFEGRGRYCSTQFTNTVKECETIRFEILEEISNLSKKLRLNGQLDENEIRALNSEINTLLKEKYKWECRIVELGGPNYRSRYSQYIESLGGVSLPNSTLKLFGAAIGLPEYKDIFQHAVEETEIDSNTENNNTVFNEGYYRETDQKTEEKIRHLENKRENELKNEKFELNLGKEVTIKSLLKLIGDKKREISGNE